MHILNKQFKKYMVINMLIPYEKLTYIIILRKNHTTLLSRCPLLSCRQKAAPEIRELLWSYTDFSVWIGFSAAVLTAPADRDRCRRTRY